MSHLNITNNDHYNATHYEILNNLFLRELPVKEVVATYVWLGGNSGDIRSKSRTVPGPVSDISELPEWNYDGSSTNQAPGEDSEVIVRPVRIFRDPFTRGNHILVFCDTYTPQGVPIPTNTRVAAKKIFDQAPQHKPWFGIEQEYTLFWNNWPLGWPKGGYPGPQGPYYCSAGADVAYGRVVLEAHYRACLYAGVKIAGTNAEVLAGQWEYQVGPCEGIESGDHHWMSRYILHRVGEIFGIVVSFDPKPIPGDWNGSGCHTNFSTLAMRQEGGWDWIIKAIKNLEPKHAEHIAVYGHGNERRLTGKHETADIKRFSYGVANRAASIRIPRVAEKERRGYFEDRRPASNMDPYVVTSKLFKTSILECADAAKWKPSA